jgi:hypothetical protein
MAGWKSTLPILGPVLAAAGLLWWLLGRDGDPGTGAGNAESPGSGEAWAAIAFEKLKPGDTVPEWEFSSGKFQIVELEGRVVLALQPEPMGEGQLRFSQLITGRGGLRARMRGERTRRATPRFSVSFHGERQFQWRAVPSGKVLEFTAEEKVLGSAPWTWEDEAWLWLELRVDGSRFEGRAWNEGQPRPAVPQVTYTSPDSPGLLRAVVQGAPFAYRPIYYDRIEVLR